MIVRHSATMTIQSDSCACEFDGDGDCWRHPRSLTIILRLVYCQNRVWNMHKQYSLTHSALPLQSVAISFCCSLQERPGPCANLSYRAMLSQSQRVI